MEPIEATIRAAFPEHPLPKAFFASAEGRGGDIPQELASRIQGRVWTSLSLLDWRLVGAHPTSYREYLVPQAFAYYAPSLLVAVISEPDFRDWALEAILPSNRKRIPKGDWWFGYAATFTGPQRAAIKSFLAYQREALRPLDMVEEELTGAAENLWA